MHWSFFLADSMHPALKWLLGSLLILLALASLGVLMFLMRHWRRLLISRTEVRRDKTAIIPPNHAAADIWKESAKRLPPDAWKTETEPTDPDEEPDR